MQEIFYNRQRSGYEEIMSYTPGYYKNIREMDANFHYAGWTTDLMAWGLEKVMTEQLVPYCSLSMISRLERFFGISADGLTENERRANLIILMTGYGKFSSEKIQDIVKTYLGCKSEVYWNGNVLNVRLLDTEDINIQISKIFPMLEKRKPAHIALVFGYLAAEIQNTNTVQLICNKHRLSTHWWNGIGYLLDGEWALDGVLALGGLRVHQARSRNRIELSTDLNNDISVTVKRNYWCLNSDYVMDGAKRLNAEIKQEVL